MAKAVSIIEVPAWLIAQFKFGNKEQAEGAGPPEGLMADRVERFDVGTFKTKGGKTVTVEFEAASGQSNWWNTVNVFDQKGNLLEQSEPGFDLLGRQEYVMEDGTSIEFDVKAGGPRDWSPRGETGLSGSTLGLHTEEERQNARILGEQMLNGMRKGRIERPVARGYLMAIRDLAKDEGHMDLAEQMQDWIRETM